MRLLLKILTVPILFLVAFYSVYFAWEFASQKYHWSFFEYFIFLPQLKDIIFLITFYWMLYNSVKSGGQLLIERAANNNHEFSS
jgi:hypothetical protein